ncbi:MAG: FAD-dependent oxidoreductase [Paracoccaceae bacterium]|nr:FAD-dependent oxidoreductase [Paracoccaceae bacterium]
MATTDLTVRGAGVFGLTIAWEALARGARVRVIDPRGPGGGASGGVVGALAPHAPEGWTALKAFQLDCLLAARSYWPQVEAASGRSTGYRRSGRLQPLAGDKALARARARGIAAATLWRGEATWEVTADVPEAAPVSETGLWVHDTLSAQLDPARAVAALAAAVAAAGSEVLREAGEAGAVVHATGWEGLRDLSATLRREIGGGEKGQAAVLAAEPGEIPQLYADRLHIVAHGAGRVAVGSTSERAFEGAETTDGELDAVIDRARSVAPWLRDAPVIGRWAGVRPRAVTRQPVVAPWPGRPGHVIANGGFKTGFALAPGLAPLAVDLALEGTDRVPEGFGLPL